MKKEYFNIPNLMGYFRILIIPAFLFLYGRAETKWEYFAAFFVLALSYLTDFLDGKIARKFHMVTDWGKMLDPIADNLTQGALAVACTFQREDFYGVGSSCDRATVIEDNGEALEERLRMIEHAKDSICMSTFDFQADTSGKQLLAALLAAADRGVQVKVLVDGFDSRLHMTANPWFYALAVHENAEIRIYNPANPFLPWRGMSRMHDKYLIADNRLYLLGGRNAYDYFLGDQDGYKNYDRDVLVYNTEADTGGGEKESSIYRLREYFDGIWEMNICRPWNEGTFAAWIPAVKRSAQGLKELYASVKSEHEEWFCQTDYWEKTVPVHKITLLFNPTGLYGKEPWVFYGLCRLMEGAEKEVLIHTPYIICDEQMYRELETVCRAVPSVTLMTNSAENNGNPFGAVDYVLNKERVLDTGLHVLEYEGGVSYHGKSIAIDDDIAIVGSFNMDMKSAYQDTELMLVVHSEELNGQLRENLMEYQKESVEAELDETELSALTDRSVPWKKRFVRGLISLLDPWIRFLM